MSKELINPKQVQQDINRGSAIIIDVREPSEYGLEHIKGAVNMPLGQIEPSKVKEVAKDKQVILQCLSGKRASDACQKVIHELPNAKVMDGGITGWKQSGFETIKNGHGISIMRQVQIIAGSFVFIGTLLGATLSQSFLVIPAFVGAGLTFAGITGWCGLAIALGKMPWNKNIGG